MILFSSSSFVASETLEPSCRGMSTFGCFHALEKVPSKHWKSSNRPYCPFGCLSLSHHLSSTPVSLLCRLETCSTFFSAVGIACILTTLHDDHACFKRWEYGNAFQNAPWIDNMHPITLFFIFIFLLLLKPRPFPSSFLPDRGFTDK